MTAKFEEDFLGRREIAQMAPASGSSRSSVGCCWQLRKARRNVQLISNSFSAAMLGMGQITAVVVLYISGNEVLAGAISVGSALTLRLLAETATAPFVTLGDQYSQVITAVVSWKRLEEPFRSRCCRRSIPMRPSVRRSTVTSCSTTSTSPTPTPGVRC